MFLQRRKLEFTDLYEEPFTSFGLSAADKFFSESELEELVSLVRRLAAEGLRGDTMAKPGAMVPELIERRILLVRGQKVMLDSHLAELYGVETKVLKRAVRRNIDRFPHDFMLELTREEYEILRSQFGTLRWGEHAKYLPYVFTEQGVAMLSSVLNSKRAVQVNIEIMRAFVRLREILSTHKDLARKLEELEKKYDEQFRAVFEAIRQLMAPSQPAPKRRIGFGVEEPKPKAYEPLAQNVKYRVSKKSA
jgi:phage regulator Rha-like protein